MPDRLAASAGIFSIQGNGLRVGPSSEDGLLVVAALREMQRLKCFLPGLSLVQHPRPRLQPLCGTLCRSTGPLTPVPAAKVPLNRARDGGHGPGPSSKRPPIEFPKVGIGWLDDGREPSNIPARPAGMGRERGAIGRHRHSAPYSPDAPIQGSCCASQLSTKQGGVDLPCVWRLPRTNLFSRPCGKPVVLGPCLCKRIRGAENSKRRLLS